MEWVEVRGRTVEEAIDEALDQLGVDEDDIEYEVLEEPRRGLFGRLGAPGARIRARVKPLSREKPNRRRRSGARTDQRRGGAPRERAAASPSRAPREPRPSRDTREKAPASEAVGGREPDRGESGDDGRREPSTEAGDTQARQRSRRRRSGRAPGTTGATTVTNGEDNAVSGTEVPVTEQLELAETFVRGLIERLGVAASIAARIGDDDDEVTIEITGDDLGFLIGSRGSTLDAVQELVRTAVQRRIGGHGARIHVDVSGYRARRQEALASFAREAAQRALESGRDQVFEPMSPGDRKIIHDTVNEIEGVATVSEGEEPRRRVVIKAV